MPSASLTRGRAAPLCASFWTEPIRSFLELLSSSHTSILSIMLKSLSQSSLRETYSSFQSGFKLFMIVSVFRICTCPSFLRFGRESVRKGSDFVQKSRSARPRPENLSLTIFPSRSLTDILAIHFLFVLYCICMCIVQTSRPLTDILAIHLDIWLLLLVLFRVQSFCFTTDIFKIHFICFC